MSIRKTPFSINEHYHVYNRGVDKRVIFVDHYDYERFVALFYICNGLGSVTMRNHLYQGKTLVGIFKIEKTDTLVDIGAYCLMPNHFHILLREKVDGGISLFMQKMSTAYSMYFNKKYERKGSLFESKFNSKHVDTDEYLNWLFSYIHLNPVKLIDKDWKENGISNPKLAKEFIQNYKYSSYYDYFLGDRIEKLILNMEVFPEHFLQSSDFEELLKEFQGKALENFIV